MRTPYHRGIVRPDRPRHSFEVHGEEGDIGKDIAVAESVIELDAVENTWTVVQAEDVVREQVAMTVSNLSMSDAIGEERPRPSR